LFFFLLMPDPSLHVVLQRCSAYDRAEISERIDKIGSQLGVAGTLHGKIVLLKPNLISSKGPPLACTHREFIAGVASWFLGQGARVLLGDSPALGSAAKVCEKQGIAEALQGMNVKFVDFVTPVEKKLAGGVKVAIAREALECDLFVGLPKVKAHNQMYVTLATKNIFGIIKGVNKGLLHMVHGSSHNRFADIILDLVSLLPEQLHLVDGIEVMHRSGPLDGNPLTLNCVAAGNCPVALDTALIELLELDLKKSPLWRVASTRGVPGSDGRNLHYPQLYPRDFHGSGFVAPVNLNAVRFNPFRFLSGMLKKVLLKISTRA
jgi:uncharacterized protein (DUF362 family)